MGEVSRALAQGAYDTAFVLLTERGLAPPSIAACFLLESGVPIGKLPSEALRALGDAKELAA
jgi:hypothetical protein